MHELSLVMSILDIASEQMRKHQANRLERIDLEIGNLAGVEMDAFEFAWEAAVANTDWEHAEKVIHRIPGRALCLECQSEYTMEQLFSPCPDCGEYLSELISGNELRIKSLVVD